MTNKKVCIYIFAFLLFTALPIQAENTFLDKNSDDPIEITSDRMDAYNEKKMVVFSGNATVVQGNSVLKSDTLFLYYKHDNDKKGKTGNLGTEGAGDLDRIEAKGNVSLVQAERVAIGDEAVYFREHNKIIMTGNAMLHEGKNSIRGDRVTVLLDENRGIVESSTQNKVKAIIYPQERKKSDVK